MVTVYNSLINPELLSLELGPIYIADITEHARDQAFCRKINLPSFFSSVKGKIVELEADGRTITKLLVRVASDELKDYDNVYVLGKIKGNRFTVLTCYKNHKTDKHSTLKMLNNR